MATLSTHIERYKELIKNPLLFLHLEDHSYHDDKGDYVESCFWKPLDKDFQGLISSEKLDGNDIGFTLVIAESTDATDENGKEKEIITFEVHSIKPDVLDDWRIVINSFIIRSQNSEDIFPYIHFLWMLNYCNWSVKNLTDALHIYNIQSVPFIINRGLCRFCRCLSYEKQQRVQQALTSFGQSYSIYQPSVINDALRCLTPSLDNNGATLNLFNLVDYILEDKYPQQQISRLIVNSTSNAILCLYRWLKDESVHIDYSLLSSLFSISSLTIQLQIVKRYFHDIRKGITPFDTKIIEDFRDNPYTDFIRYRYCLETPEMQVSLAVPLLCDCILTIYQSGGKAFQSFDGILDFAMQRCDVTKPSITLGMEKFLPQCHGGAVYNSEFKGFVDYAIVCELDESKFTEKNLTDTIKGLLNKRQHLRYYACGFDEQKKPLSEEEKAKCLSIRKIADANIGQEKEERKFSCAVEYEYENKWIAFENDYQWLNAFLIEPLPVVENQQNYKSIIIDINHTSTKVMETYIRSLAAQCEQVDGNLFVVHSCDIRNLKLLLQYSKPISSRFFPQNKSIVGIKFDVFGILKDIRQENNLNTHDISDTIKAEFIRRESEKLMTRVVETLKQELKVKDYNGSYFEIPYNRDIHRKILGLYYFKGSIPEKTVDSQIEFLKRQYLGSFIPFCAPKLAEVPNRATSMPYFWCRGVECFHNNLDSQKLETCVSWKDYSLYHLIEIIGYPKIYETEAGLEPDRTITEFIACANRVMKKFRRLKCRNCGHLMYTDKSSGYNRYNYYSCINPTCSEYNRPVYLSYCYKCKKGLIDSRDSVQCPNGWYICPTCLSCCDDNQYERQAQRYILAKLPIPKRISEKLGWGHNDKGEYFCPKCGGAVIDMADEHGYNHRICQKCGVTYNEQHLNDLY